MPLSLRWLLLGAALFATVNIADAAPQITGFSNRTLDLDPKLQPGLNLEDPFGITMSAIIGDRALLAYARRASQPRIDDVDPPRTGLYFSTLADSAANRIRGAFDASNPQLDAERRSLHAYADPAQHLNTLVMLLDLEETGDAFLANDMHSWAVQRARLDALYLMPLRSYYHMPTLRLEGFENITLDTSPDDVPSPRTQEAAENHVDFLPSGHSVEHKILLDTVMPVTIDGQPARMSFNTGSFSGSVPESYATSHHLKVVATAHHVGDGGGFYREAKMVVMPEIRIGDTILTNQIFMTAPAPTFYLGLQQIATLHHVIADRHGVSFGTAHAFSCKTELHGRAQRSGYAMDLLFPIALNDDHFDAMLVIGDEAPEVLNIRTRHLPAALEAHKMTESITSANGYGSETIAHVPAWITIGATLLDDAVVYSVSSQKMMPAITASVLRYATFKVDFSEHVACLDPASQSD